MSEEAWNNIQSASFKISQMAQVTPISLESRLSESFIGKQKTCILDIISNRFYFGEVQEEVLGQYSGQGISVPRKEGLSVYHWSVPEKNE